MKIDLSKGVGTQLQASLNTHVNDGASRPLALMKQLG